MRKMKGRVLKKIVIVGVFCVIINNFGLSASYAAGKPSKESLFKLSLFQGVVKCYEDYAKDPVSLGEYNVSGFESIFRTSLANLKSSGDVWVTTEVGNTNTTGNVGCGQIFLGGGGISGLTDYYKMPDSLSGLGYRLIGSSVDTSKSGTADADVDQITFSIESVVNNGGNDNKKMNVSGEISCKGQQKFVDRLIFRDYYTWSLTECYGDLSVVYDAANEVIFGLGFYGENDVPSVRGENLVYDGNTLQLDLEDLSSSASRMSLSSAFNGSNFRKHLVEDIERAALTKYAEPDVNIKHRVSAYGGASSEYGVVRNSREAAKVMLYNIGVDANLPNFISDDSVYNVQYVNYYWHSDWIYSLYYNYLKNMLKKYPDMSISGCGNERPSSTWAFKNSSSQWCAIDNADLAQDEIVSVPDGSLSMRQGRFKEVLEWFNSEESYQNVSEDAYALEAVNGDGTIDPEDGDDNGIGDACRGESGVLGWLLCPIVEGASGIGGYMWDRIENHHLKIPAQEMFESDSGVYPAWSVVRDIANIAFIVLLLFVIFSQLTGVGIDNYGIKKILPKLIVVAVLVNLSYVICQLAVDLSNVLGMGLNSMLSGFATGLESEEIKNASGAAVASGWTIDLALAGGGAALYGLLAGGATFALAGVALGMAVLGVVITVVVALLTLYLILVVREGLFAAALSTASAVSPSAVQIIALIPAELKRYSKSCSTSWLVAGIAMAPILWSARIANQN